MAASRARRSNTAARTASRKTARPQPKPAKKRSVGTRSTADDYAKIIKMLKDDHEKVGKLFKKFEKLKKTEDDSRYELVEEACKALEVHAAIEEQHFYPAAYSAVSEGDKEDDMLDEAEVEHTHIKEIVAELKAKAEDDPLCDAKFKVLGEYVTHHVKEEEEELFPKLKKFKEVFEGVYEQMVELRTQMEAGGTAILTTSDNRAGARELQ